MKRRNKALVALMMTAQVLGSVSVPAMAAENLVFEEIGEDTYKILAGDSLAGYLLAGTDKALVIGVDQEAPVIDGTEYVDGKEVIYTDTNTSAERIYELGGREVEAVDLKTADVLYGKAFPASVVEKKESVGYRDIENGLMFTEENIGTGEVSIGSSDNLVMQSWGKSYGDMLSFDASVREYELLIGETTDAVVYNNEGEAVEKSYIDDLSELMEKIVNFDTDLVYEFDMSQDTANYIAENGSAKVTLHDASYGFLGYKLIHTDIEDQSYGRTRYFSVNYNDEFYILKDTDVQANYLYVGEDEALLIDCGEFAGPELWERIQYLIGDKPLNIYITHEHGDHWYNIQYFDAEQIKAVYLMDQCEPRRVGENTGVYDVNADFLPGGRLEGKRIYIKDQETFTVVGREFKMVHMKGHSENGSALIDLKGRHLFAGDSLGTQSYIGGTNVRAETLDTWVEDLAHISEAVKINTDDCLVDNIFMGHLAYPITKDYITWVTTCLNQIVENGPESVVEIEGAAKSSKLVITENGEIIGQERAQDVYTNDVTEKELAAFGSIGWRD